MCREYWLPLKSHLKKYSSRLGLFLRLSLILFVFNGLPILAYSQITVEKIQILALQYQGDTQKRFNAWAKLIASLKNKPEPEQLEKVNSFFNQFEYQPDTGQGDSDDYWKSPIEFIVDGGGDCEDYAIIKYFSLITLGVPTEKLRITYVSSLTLNQAHMVLSYYPSPEAEPLILDSLDSKIKKASKRPDLKPIYSFNGDGLWLAKKIGQETSVGDPGSLNKWNDLIKRME
jgi:predicted transglutaminase-like cysteine proteinase